MSTQLPAHMCIFSYARPFMTFYGAESINLDRPHRESTSLIELDHLRLTYTGCAQCGGFRDPRRSTQHAQRHVRGTSVIRNFRLSRSRHDAFRRHNNDVVRIGSGLLSMTSIGTMSRDNRLVTPRTNARLAKVLRSPRRCRLL